MRDCICTERNQSHTIKRYFIFRFLFISWSHCEEWDNKLSVWCSLLANLALEFLLQLTSNAFLTTLSCLSQLSRSSERLWRSVTSYCRVIKSVSVQIAGSAIQLIDTLVESINVLSRWTPSWLVILDDGASGSAFMKSGTYMYA